MTNIVVHVVVIIAQRNELRDSDLPNSYLSKLSSEYLQEFIRRWDSERELFNDDIAHT